ncbi:uncharacterized protein EDB91DRAFT_1088633 [Suillus paluster]|uniref:uncharacterized protein n=1 Tax=Suillus paluster TaxID=48578 RepID=UPI001B87AC99|nr:uncharacterized protein EDB91DRAFT_1088633 [Suillus paluster]KAG1720950.1 hypothetical protein EDB91DRAFT_1088633 [Suillus paluster]
MAGTEWVTAEQKEFLQGLYNDFLKAQLEATLAAFWTEVYRTWFEKWPEISIMYPGVPDHESLTEEQNELLGIAVKKRHQMLGNRAKGTQVHTVAEIFAKSSHGADVHIKLRNAIDSGSIVTKGEKLNAMRKLAQEAYTAASPDVQASCIATVQAERDAKASEVLKQKRAPEERTNTELAKALEECPGPIAHFLQAIHEMTGFHWSIMGAGPDPRYNGDINVISYHTGVNEQGQNWMQATPEFNERHLKPFTAFVSCLFPEHMRKTRALSYVPPTPSQQDTLVLGAEQGVPEPGMQVFSHAPLPPASAPIASLLLSFDTPDFASLCASGSSGYMELPTFDMYDDNLNVPPSSSTSLMPYLNSPSSSPISSWNRGARDSQNYTSPPHVRSRDILDSFLDQTAPSDAPKFNFPPISAPAGAFLDVPQPLGTESGGNAAAATADLALASSAGEDAITEASNDPQPPLGTDSESVDAIVADAPPTVGATIVADVAAPQTLAPMAAPQTLAPTIVTDVAVPPAVRKTGRVRMETTQLVQANNIGQNMKRVRPAARHSIASGPPKNSIHLVQNHEPAKGQIWPQKSQKERKSRGKEQA